jgi:hypothetical protein
MAFWIGTDPVDAEHMLIRSDDVRRSIAIRDDLRGGRLLLLTPFLLQMYEQAVRNRFRQRCLDLRRG